MLTVMKLLEFLKHNLLVCNWLHSIGQNHFYVMMILYREAALSRIYTYVLFFKELCGFQGS
jgi:hypothetical protein